MLVLSRKVGERIWIGQDVAITLVRIDGQIARIGVTAPPATRILREELSNDHAQTAPLARGPRLASTGD